jgi:hypothetical protein
VPPAFKAPAATIGSGSRSVATVPPINHHSEQLQWRQWRRGAEAGTGASQVPRALQRRRPHPLPLLSLDPPPPKLCLPPLVWQLRDPLRLLPCCRAVAAVAAAAAASESSPAHSLAVAPRPAAAWTFAIAVHTVMHVGAPRLTSIG